MAGMQAWLDPEAPRWRSPAGRRLWRALDRGLVAGAAALSLLLRLRGQGHGLALVYHRLGPEAGDLARELLPAIATADFDRQIAHVARWYRLVPAADLPAAAAARRRGRRLPLAITFDDDDPGHLAHAAPILRRHGAPASFFLCGGSLAAPRTYWWERLQRLADAGRIAEAPVPAEEIHAAAAAIVAMPPADRDAADDALGALLGDEPPGAGLRTDQVGRLAREGFEIGFHTLRHHPLDTLDDTELERALTEGRAALEQAVGRSLRAIAYPNGGADARTAPAAAAAGFTAGYTTAGTPLWPGTPAHLIGRMEPRSPSLGVFALRLARAHARRPS